MSVSPTLQFLGATGTVTGSRYLLRCEAGTVLVDCGLFQGRRATRQRNWESPGFRWQGLQAIVLTHAHIDHSGYLPRLYRAGYRGPVFCTPGTRDLLKVLLPDSGYLQEEQAKHANKYRWSRHEPALPLYTRADAEGTLSLLQPRAQGAEHLVLPELTVGFSRAGHIVGSACVRVTTGETSICFSGDVGRPVDPIMKPPAPPPIADTLVVESTYGDRLHDDGDILETLERVLAATFERGGAVIVPAFAVGRSQHLLHLVATLQEAGRLPMVPVFLDSPMAINATGIFCDNMIDHRLTEPQCMAMCDAAKYTATAEESKAIDRMSGPMIVISASGMATGGRILHHLKRFLPDERNTILLVGFQAAGTRGRQLVEGAEELRIHGQTVPVRAEIVQTENLSAHADWKELVTWLGAIPKPPRQVFVTHGEPQASRAFRDRLEQELGWNARIPEHGETIDLEDGP